MNAYYYRLSKLLSHALRHAPEEYGFYLDKDGWVEINSLITSFKEKDACFKKLSKQDLIEMIKQSSKIRHEIKENKIRALYGHSTQEKIIKKSSIPPEILYYGSAPENVSLILKGGLKSMNRQHVYLSIDQVTAQQVGIRKNSFPIIFKVKAKEASEQGIHFFMGMKAFGWLITLHRNI